MGLFSIFKKEETKDKIIVHAKDVSLKYTKETDIVTKELIDFLKNVNSNPSEYENIVKSFCTEDLISIGITNNNRFGYIEDEIDVYFSMVEDRVSNVEIYYMDGVISKKDKFTLRKKNDKWKLDSIYTGFSNKEGWKMIHL